VGGTAGGVSRATRQAEPRVCVDDRAFSRATPAAEPSVGVDDRAIDIRVDDHANPFGELGRLLDYAQMNYSWNEAWTLFTQKKPAEALPHMERAVRLAPTNAEAHYDLAVIRLAAGNRGGATEALDEAFALNPKLRAQAAGDKDLEQLRIKN